MRRSLRWEKQGGESHRSETKMLGRAQSVEEGIKLRTISRGALNGGSGARENGGVP
jgi:hypothetical protein